MNIGFKEDLHNEFKSDLKCISDSDIIDVVIAFANTDGGTLYIGVEDNGDITGVHPNHKDTTKLAAFIANKTVPPVTVSIEKEDDAYIKIIVPCCRSIVASSTGKLLRRRIKTDNTPENVPLYPHEINSRLSDLSLLDFSAQCVPDTQYSDLDDIERERLRNIIRSYHGEQALLELENDELDKALRLVDEVDGDDVVTMRIKGFQGGGRNSRSDVLVLSVLPTGSLEGLHAVEVNFRVFVPNKFKLEAGDVFHIQLHRLTHPAGAGLEQGADGAHTSVGVAAEAGFVGVPVAVVEVNSKPVVRNHCFVRGPLPQFGIFIVRALNYVILRANGVPQRAAS